MMGIYIYCILLKRGNRSEGSKDQLEKPFNNATMNNEPKVYNLTRSHVLASELVELDTVKVWPKLAPLGFTLVQALKILKGLTKKLV